MKSLMMSIGTTSDGLIPALQKSKHRSENVMLCGIRSHANQDDVEGKEEQYDENLHYCTLELFHVPLTASARTAAMGKGFVSKDGHLFACSEKPPAGHAYHVIFVIDMSGSMTSTDVHPAD
jgi:Mg-chelatase subunit ChlD